MFPIAAPKLEEFSPDVQAMLLATVNKAQPQANPFLLHTPGIPEAGKSTLVDSLTQLLKVRKPVVVAFDGSTESGANYRLLQMLLEKRANIIFDHSGANGQHMPLLRYATAIGYKVSLCPTSVQSESEEYLTAYRALGATLYEMGDEDEEALGAQIAKAI